MVYYRSLWMLSVTQYDSPWVTHIWYMYLPCQRSLRNCSLNQNINRPPYSDTSWHATRIHVGSPSSRTCHHQPNVFCHLIQTSFSHTNTWLQTLMKVMHFLITLILPLHKNPSNFIIRVDSQGVIHVHLFCRNSQTSKPFSPILERNSR